MASGMRGISEALLRERLRRGGPLLDAGCGTGGFLAWAARSGVAPLAGVDPSAEAVERARAQVPAADVRVAELAALPFPDASFAVATCNDVLQHVDEHDVADRSRSCDAFSGSDGVLLVRTNGGVARAVSGPTGGSTTGRRSSQSSSAPTFGAGGRRT